MKKSRKLNATISLVELQAMPNGGGSDISLKKDVKEIESGLEQILALRPVSWHWKSDESNVDPEHGFIAQEVEEILPSLVSVSAWKDGSDRKFLSTKEMIPFLVAAIQEQQAQIDELRSKTKQ